MLKLGGTKKSAEPLDAAGLLRSYGVRPVPEREVVAVAAARDAQTHTGASVGQPDIGLGRIDAEGQGMLAKLNHDLDLNLQLVDEEIAGHRQEIDQQAEVVEDERRHVAEKASAKQQLIATLEARAVARGKPPHQLGLRKLSTRAYLALLVVLGLADTIFNATALLVIRDTTLNVLVLALALMVALLFVSHVAGNELRAAEERRDQPGDGRKPWWAVVCLITITAALLAIGAIRAEYLAEQHSDGYLSGALLGAVYGLQFLIAVAAVAAAYYHADPDAAALQQADAALEQANEHEEAAVADLVELWVRLKELQIEKVYTVRRYLRVGEAALTLINELKFLYVTVYLQTLRAAARPMFEIAIPSTPHPEWMRARRRWVDEQDDVDQAAAVPAQRRELAPPDA
jgi:hypothetical protein